MFGLYKTVSFWTVTETHSFTSLIGTGSSEADLMRRWDSNPDTDDNLELLNNSEDGVFKTYRGSDKTITLKIAAITQWDNLTVDKTFNLKDALAGKPVKTLDGRVVTDIRVEHTDAPISAKAVDEYEGEMYLMGISGVIHNDRFANRYPFYHNGEAHIYGLPTNSDLVMA